MDTAWFRELKERQEKKREAEADRFIARAAAEGRACGDRLHRALLRVDRLDKELADAMVEDDRARILELAVQMPEAIAEFRAIAEFEGRETSRLRRLSESLLAILRKHEVING